MFRTISPLLPLSIFACTALFLTGCEETDPRFSAQTQYLGGVYGNAPTSGAPRDSVSYWDGDNIGGKPSVKISLSEQRAYFYKNNMLVGISQLSTGREGLNTPAGHYSIIQKDLNHVSSKYGDYVDDAGNVIMPNVDVEKDKKPPGRTTRVRPCPISCALWEASACMPVIFRAIRPRTVAFACLNSWRRIFSSRFRRARRSQL